MKTLSCGVLIVNEIGEILIGHATGQPHWDLPKGTIDPGETPLQCALREAQEEFDLIVPSQEVGDLGRHYYNAAKDLHLYCWFVNKKDIDISALRCNSMFNYNGYEIPEIEAYKWISIFEVSTHMAKSMTILLEKLFTIPEVVLQ